MELDKSESAGLRVARVIAELEQRFLRNRKQVFTNAIKSGNSKAEDSGK